MAYRRGESQEGESRLQGEAEPSSKRILATFERMDVIHRELDRLAGLGRVGEPGLDGSSRMGRRRSSASAAGSPGSRKDDWDAQEESLLEGTSRMEMEEHFVACCRPNPCDVRLLALLGLEGETLLNEDYERVFEYFHNRHLLMDRHYVSQRQASKHANAGSEAADAQGGQLADEIAKQKKLPILQKRGQKASEAVAGTPKRSKTKRLNAQLFTTSQLIAEQQGEGTQPGAPASPGSQRLSLLTTGKLARALVKKRLQRVSALQTVGDAGREEGEASEQAAAGTEEEDSPSAAAASSAATMDRVGQSLGSRVPRSGLQKRSGPRSELGETRSNFASNAASTAGEEADSIDGSAMPSAASSPRSAAASSRGPPRTKGRSAVEGPGTDAAAPAALVDKLARQSKPPMREKLQLPAL